MKKSETITNSLRQIDSNELPQINGGSFAYDLGRLIRYVGIYIYEGTGIRGNMYAYTDFVTNMAVNNM